MQRLYAHFKSPTHPRPLTHIALSHGKFGAQAPCAEPYTTLKQTNIPLNDQWLHDYLTRCWPFWCWKLTLSTSLSVWQEKRLTHGHFTMLPALHLPPKPHLQPRLHDILQRSSRRCCRTSQSTNLYMLKNSSMWSAMCDRLMQKLSVCLSWLIIRLKSEQQLMGLEETAALGLWSWWVHRAP